MYNFKDSFAKLRNSPSMRYIILGIVLIILVPLIAYIYIKYFTPKLKELYKPNKEQSPTFSTNGSTSNLAELLFFSADWCPHCKKALPYWNASKATYNNQKIDGFTVIYTEVNCTKPNGTTEKQMDQYGVQGFPTLVLLKNNQPIEYNGEITEDGIKKFLYDNL